MSWLLGLGLVAAPGGLVVYGALTGRLAAIVAAFVKPSDLGTPGQQYEGGAESEKQEGTFANEGELNALQQQAITWGLTTNPKWKAAYDATVKPLVLKATSTDKSADIIAAITAYRALNQEYKPKGAASGGSSAAPPGTPQHRRVRTVKPGPGRPPEVGRGPGTS